MCYSVAAAVCMVLAAAAAEGTRPRLLGFGTAALWLLTSFLLLFGAGETPPQYRCCAWAPRSHPSRFATSPPHKYTNAHSVCRYLGICSPALLMGFHLFHGFSSVSFCCIWYLGRHMFNLRCLAAVCSRGTVRLPLLGTGVTASTR